MDIDVNQRGYLTGRTVLDAAWERVANLIAPNGGIFRSCANLICGRRNLFWPVWLRGSEGMQLQGRWYCSPDCFEHAVLDDFVRLLALPEDAHRKTHRIPIGLVLLSRGMINDAQLKRALALQREQGTGRIGKFLQQIEAVTDQQIAVGLSAQWGCPVYPLARARDFLQCATLLPLTLLEAGRMMPVHHTRLQETLHLGFVEGVDRTALYAVEKMLRLRTIPCIVSESSMAEALEELRHISVVPTTVFDSPIEAREMARTTRSYALQLNAHAAWMVRSGKFIWIRLETAQGPKDILFRTLTGV